MDLSIVIVNWNVRELLRTALQSIQKNPSKKYAYEVIVVDNASLDQSVEMLRQDFPWVTLVASDKNLGFAAGNNAGFKIAAGRILLCLNPDTEMHAGTLDFIVEQFDKDPQLGAMGVKLLNADGSLQPSCKSFPGIDTILWNALSLDVAFPKSKLFGKYNMTWFDHATEREVDQPMGAALAFRGSVLAQVGEYDERYFMYFDEVDLCFRVKKAGWKIKYFPQVVVTHHWAQSTKQVLFSMNRQWYLSFAKYLEKNYGYARWFTWFMLTSMVWMKFVLVLCVVLFIVHIVSAL
jgi:hypothetical protein